MTPDDARIARPPAPRSPARRAPTRLLEAPRHRERIPTVVVPEHVDIRPEHVHIPDGSVPRERLAEHCDAYERAIAEAGGIDLQLLGIGKSGHIGFNEPGSSQDSRTGLAILDTVTRKDAAADFFGEDNVPREAITMGVATILDAREIALIATGEHKANIVARAV